MSYRRARNVGAWDLFGVNFDPPPLKVYRGTSLIRKRTPTRTIVGP